MPTNSTQPTIIWKQYKNGGTDDFSKGNTLTGNTVDYSAVQAGQYSPAICVRPQFSNSETASSIGCIRLWWSTQTATPPSGGQSVSLPGAGWVLKYYVTNCDTTDVQYGNSGANAYENCSRMLSYLGNSQNVTKVASGVTFNAPNQLTNSNNYVWCKSTWQSDMSIGVSMQPVPLVSYKDSVAGHQDEYSRAYNPNVWYSVVFGANQKPNDGLYWAAGGILSGSTYKCNIKDQVTTNQEFPFIFFTIKAPTTADAGTWSGWACRISYIWPYNTSTTTTP